MRGEGVVHNDYTGVTIQFEVITCAPPSYTVIHQKMTDKD